MHIPRFVNQFNHFLLVLVSFPGVLIDFSGKSGNDKE